MGVKGFGPGSNKDDPCIVLPVGSNTLMLRNGWLNWHVEDAVDHGGVSQRTGFDRRQVSASL